MQIRNITIPGLVWVHPISMIATLSITIRCFILPSIGYSDCLPIQHTNNRNSS